MGGVKKQKIVTLISSVLSFIIIFLSSKLLADYTVMHSLGFIFALSMGALVFLLFWPQAISPEEKNPVNRFLIWGLSADNLMGAQA